MTVVRARDQLAATSSQVTFAVDAPQVSLAVRLADAPLDPSQPLEATLAVTNTSPLPQSGDLALLTLATTGNTIEAWIFSLAHDATIQRSGRFVP